MQGVGRGHRGGYTICIAAQIFLAEIGNIPSCIVNIPK
ncbi:hypothetical protein VP177E371_P0080 [Vibrio phage 177E37-1]|nr:hypothetical protein VP177E371_P0080 [Vibrio phage 177E37-1]